MRYDITNRLFAQRAAADQAAAGDSRRAEFLRRLDEAGFEVTEFEAQFLESFLQARSPAWWTENRRTVVDKLMERYAARLPEFCAHAAAPPPGAKATFPPHVPGECGYLVRGDDRQLVRCGKPVAFRTPGGLEICADHKQARAEWRKRMNDRRRNP